MAATWIRASDHFAWRVAVAVRVFGLTLVVALCAVAQVLPSMTSVLLLLAAVAAAGSVPRHSPQTDHWAMVAEGLLVGVVIGSADRMDLLAPYLLVAPLAAGFRVGATSATITYSAQAIGFIGVALGNLSSVDEVTQVTTTTEVGPWLVAALGIGLLAAWIRRTQGRQPSNEVAPYESAHRLLAQLRVVSRRLSGGLDPVGLAQRMLDDVRAALGDTTTFGGPRGVVFVRTDGGVLVPLAHTGDESWLSLVTDDAVVGEAWASESAAQRLTTSGSAEHRHRVAMPLRVGFRVMGVVVVDLPEQVPGEALTRTQRTLDEDSLRLETAMLFDEVRSIATAEERQRLAREIHDGIAQEIASLGYLVDDIAAAATSLNTRAGLGRLRQELSRVVSELRLSIFDLRSEITPTSGLGAALSDYVRQVGARSGFTVHLVLDETPRRLRIEVEAELLRIAQEAVTNARKHAGAQNLWVTWRVQPPNAELRIDDDGRGLGAAGEHSFGLEIMKERAARIGATLQVTDRATIEPGTQGTSVHVVLGTTGELPLPTARRHLNGKEEPRVHHGVVG